VGDSGAAATEGTTEASAGRTEKINEAGDLMRDGDLIRGRILLNAETGKEGEHHVGEQWRVRGSECRGRKPVLPEKRHRLLHHSLSAKVLRAPTTILITR
jgi:hypothetical protein